MRKLDLIIVLLVVAVVSALANHWKARDVLAGVPAVAGTPKLKGSPTAEFLTSSGRWKILPCAYSLAELHLGMRDTEVRACRGQPTSINKQNGETQIWLYDSGLNLTFLEGRLLSVVASGRWEIREGDRRIPGFMHTQSELKAAMGEPVSQEGSNWRYQQGPCELTFQFTGEHIQTVQISSQVQSMPVIVKTTTPVQVSP